MRTYQTRKLQPEESLDTYLREMSAYPLLPKEEESKLLRAYHNPATSSEEKERIREKVITSNLRFVVKIAKQYRYTGIPFEHLIGEGNSGLIEALEKYDTTRGTRFLTCAVWWIKHSIGEYVKMNWVLQGSRIDAPRI